MKKGIPVMPGEANRLGEARLAAALATVLAAVLAACVLALVAGPAEAAFPGKNGKIAFERGTKIWMKNPSFASAETKLRDETTADSQSAFSPDGSRVAFMRLNEIYVANADGTGTLTRLTNDCLLDSNPAWSHDGTKIVFVRRSSDDPNNPCGGQFDIWTMNADGSNQVQRTSDGGNNRPAWSVPLPGAPDGKIVYKHGGAELWTMNPDGSGKGELNFSCPTDNGICDTSIGVPTFSPDGTKIAFDYSGDIYWTTTAGGGNSTPILRGATPADEYPGDEQEAAWSPDGEKIAFQHNGNVPGSPYDIYVANADGGSTQATRITSQGGTNPDWQQDSLPPATTITSGPASVTKATSASLSFVSSETDSTFECSLDGAAYASCVSPKSYTVANGTHAFRVRATDAAGNVDTTPATHRWTVDTVRPAISGMSPRPGARIQDHTPTIKATVRDNLTNLGKSNVKLYVNNRLISAAKYGYNQSTDQLVYKSPKLREGKKIVKVLATDAAGNAGSRAWRFTIR